MSPGCAHCYAERMARRLKAMGQPNYASGFDIACHDHAVALPLSWKKPQMIFVNSMSDLFHQGVPTDFITKVFSVMNRANWHCFQILTKRSRRLLQMDADLQWRPNIWMGVSVEDSKYSFRIENLRKTNAAVKFISFEPLIGPVGKVDLQGIDWVIVGGESGPGARPMAKEWAVEIRDQCIANRIPFFFKQWGGVNKKAAGRSLVGRTWSEMPAVAQFAV